MGYMSASRLFHFKKIKFQLFGIPHVVIYNFDRIILHNDSFIKILTTFSQTIVFPLIIPLNLFSARSTVQLIAISDNVIAKRYHLSL